MNNKGQSRLYQYNVFSPQIIVILIMCILQERCVKTAIGLTVLDILVVTVTRGKTATIAGFYNTVALQSIVSVTGFTPR